MEAMTAEQAAEWGKTLDFSTVWATIQELSKERREAQQEADKRQQELDKRFQETDRIVKELSKNIGGVNKSFGRLMEEMYSARLWDKFAVFGYEFTCGCQRKKFRENDQSLAEADLFLENGLYAMVVEVKTDLTTEDVDEHLERIATIRDYMDRHGDKRFLVGAVAGGIAPKDVVRYAQKKGLYVVGWSGDAAMVAEAPPSFKAREWAALSHARQSGTETRGRRG
jgi:predicted RNase H-like nuclease (RuvC/YqgF family)